MKLNIGAGIDIREGWVNTDIDDDWNTMHRESDMYDAILFNHCAMYVRPKEMKILLKKWFLWLKKGGTLHIETQDLNKIPNFEDKERLLYGEGENAGHKWAWTPQSLKQEMLNAGFENVRAIPGILHGWPERDFLIVGEKI